MDAYTQAPALVGLIILTVSAVIYYSVEYARHSIRAKALGCGSPNRCRNKLPFGIDFLWTMMKADQEFRVPQKLLEVSRNAKHATFIHQSAGSDVVVTSDPKNVQAILALQFKDFCVGAKRRQNFYPMLGNGIFTADGEMWEHSRAILRPQFSRGQVSDLDLEERHVQEMFNQLKVDSSGWTLSIDLAPIFFRLTMDTATEFLFGESVNSQRAHNPDHSLGLPPRDLRWSKVGASFDRGTATLGTRGRLEDFYWLVNPKSFRKDIREIHKFADYCIDQAIKRRQSGVKSQQKYIFMDQLLESVSDPVEVRSQLLNIFLAGRDTTAGLLGWTFWCLARDPRAYDKLRASIVESFGASEKEDTITFAGLKSCTYLQHVMNEVLRLYPSVPFNERQATKDTTLPRGGGPDGSAPVYITKHQTVSYSVFVMHRRKDLWGPDADDFNPDRWVGRKVGWEYLPFNGGPRICLGQQFALTEAGYVIARMVQRFEKIANTDPEGEPLHQYTLTSSPKNTFVKLYQG